VYVCFFFFFQAEDGIRDFHVTGVQTCALPITSPPRKVSAVFCDVTSNASPVSSVVTTRFERAIWPPSGLLSRTSKEKLISRETSGITSQVGDRLFVSKASFEGKYRFEDAIGGRDRNKGPTFDSAEGGCTATSLSCCSHE